MKIGYCNIINIAGIDFYKDVGKDLYFYKDAIRMENKGIKRLPTESELELLSKSPYVIKDEYCYFANNLIDLNDENKYLGFNKKLAFGTPMLKLDMWEMKLFEYNGSNKKLRSTKQGTFY